MPMARRAYETDGLTAYRQAPLVVALPSTTAEVAAVLRYCHENRLKVVPRGAGTSLSGGALPLADGVLLGMAKFNRVLDVDIANRGGRGSAGGHQSRHQPGGGRSRLLLRARSLQPDRLHHRRQCGREFGRRALPEIRPDHQQSARPRDGADDRRGAAPGRPASRCRRLRSHGRGDRFGGPAGRGHRGDGAHPAETQHPAGAAPRLCQLRERGRYASPRSSPPASFPPAWR